MTPILTEAGFAVRESWISGMDPWQGKRLLGRSMTGGGLLRVFIAEKP